MLFGATTPAAAPSSASPPPTSFSSASFYVNEKDCRQGMTALMHAAALPSTSSISSPFPLPGFPARFISNLSQNNADSVPEGKKGGKSDKGAGKKDSSKKNRRATDMCVFLLRMGADIYLTDSMGNNALMHAIMYGNLDMVELLLQWDMYVTVASLATSLGLRDKESKERKEREEREERERERVQWYNM